MVDLETVNPKKAESNIQIDYVTSSGSAFALCNNGDWVFLHARLVDKMDLDEGDMCQAVLLENYSDKKDFTPWRAVRVSNIL